MYVCETRSRRILAANNAAVKMYGYSTEELCSMTTFDLRPPEEHERLRAWAAAAHDRTNDFVDAGLWQHVRRDGSIITVQVMNMSGITYEGYAADLALILDVTEAQQRFDALTAYQVALDEAQQLGDLGTVMVDMRKKTCKVTGILARAFGHSELTLDQYFALTPKIIDAEMSAEASRLLDATRRMQPYEDEFRIHLDGLERWIHARRSIIRDDAGQAIGFIGVARDITDRRLEAERLRSLAFRDPETGLLTWSGLMDALPGDPPIGAVLLVKMSWLAAAAERLPETRQSMVQSVARLLGQIAGPKAELVRYARDIFAVILRSRAHMRTAVGLAERIAALFERPVATADQDFIVVPTVGVCTRRGTEHSVSDLAARAEAALKEAETSPNRIAIYCRALEEAHDRRIAIQQHLRHAISGRSVSIAYQPVISLARRTIVGVEALMRWECPGIGAVPPSEFIAAAEETGVILSLGEWILREACAQARRWQLRGLPAIRMAVNVSALQVQQPDFLRVVTAACEATNLKPSHLELEITERVMLQPESCALRNLEALRRLGVRISVDDFGTGYSSLSTLATLPLDTIKLDRTFVETVPDDAFQADMVQSIINIAHRRTLNVVGEGVETPRQAQALLQMGCDEVQGFLFGYPTSAHEVGILLAADQSSTGQHEISTRFPRVLGEGVPALAGAML